MANLGFVGLGAMGGRVTKRLLDAGHTVIGYNRTRSKAQWLLDAGMRWGDSPRTVAQAAEDTFSMETNTPAMEAGTLGPDTILARLRPRSLHVGRGTINPSKPRAVSHH